MLSDTHIRRGSARRLSSAAYRELERADLVLHAGDVVVPEFLDELAGFAPVHAVLGNNDHELFGVLPDTRVVEIGGVRVGMVHDSGPRPGRAARMRARFTDAGVVVFGHSHEPVDEVGIYGQRLMNPGSPTERRSAPAHSMLMLTIRKGRITPELVTL